MIPYTPIATIADVIEYTTLAFFLKPLLNLPEKPKIAILILGSRDFFNLMGSTKSGGPTSGITVGAIGGFTPIA